MSDEPIEKKKPKNYKEDKWQSVGKVSLQESSPHAFRKFFSMPIPKKETDKDIENIEPGNTK